MALVHCKPVCDCKLSQFNLTVLSFCSSPDAIHSLPCGITGGIITIHAAIYPKHYRPRYLLGPAFILCAIGSLLFSFADTEDKYWRFMFPGLVIGTIGGACAYVTCNIAIMQSGPPEFSGVLGAM